MRHYENWLEGFLHYTAGKNSPTKFRLWAGMSAVAAGLQRRCYTHLMETNLYPNLFILLVSDPGVGKSMAIRAARDVIRDNARVKLAPQRCTKEAFYDEIEAAVINTPNLETGLLESQHAITGMIDEFGIFVRRGDLDFMADLADLYDCPDPFEYKTKHASKLVLRRSWFNFISGCTPAWMKESFTDVALEQGFPARVMTIYSDESFTPDLFKITSKDAGKAESLLALQEDLGEILQMEGEFTWEKDAAEAFQKWVNSGLKPYPPDPRLKHYNTRRIIHIPKICMVVSAAQRSTLTVTYADFKIAQRILLEAELDMHKAYSAISKNVYFTGVEAVVKLVLMDFAATKKGVPEHKIRRALEREVPYQYIVQILDQLVASKRLDVYGESPHRLFAPGGVDGHTELGNLGGRPEAEDGAAPEVDKAS